MPHIDYQTITVTTTTASSGNGFTTVVNGWVEAIRYKGGLKNSADLTITGETSGTPVLVDSCTSTATGEIFYPRVKVNTASTGAASTARVPIAVGNERIKIAVVQGGASNTATFIVMVNGGFGP